MTMAPPPIQCDIAIIGGGVIGSSVAYFVKPLTPHAEVCVIEPDATHEYASTLRASGGCRVQFTGVENIDRSLFGIEFIRDFGETMAITGPSESVPGHADRVEGGDLFIVPPEQMKGLEAAAAVQRSRGATVEVLSPSELKFRFPSIRSTISAVARSPRTTAGAIRTARCGASGRRRNRSAWPKSPSTSSART